jgi:small-conductance mechanosensitive channel
MLLEAARRTDEIKQDPPPFVLCKSLTDYAVSYELNTFPSADNGLPRLESLLNNNILDDFSESNEQIMTPSYVADPESPKLAPPTGDKNLSST